MAPEVKLTKKVTADKGVGPPLPRIVVERAPEVEPRRFYVLSADIEAHGHTGGCPEWAALASHGKATKPHNDECRERIRTIIERTLTGKARMNEYKDRIPESERVKKRKRARVERGAGDVLLELGNRDDEQVAVRHADASGGDIRENQHEEDRMRDIHIGKRGPEAAGEEQPDKLRKTVRFEQEASSASASSDPTVALEYLASGETQSRPRCPYLCRSQVMLMTTCKFLRWIHSTRWMDERDVTSEKCWSGIEEKMPEISRDVNEMNWLRI